MNLRTFLTISALVALVYGLGLILVPASLATLYGIGTGASEMLFARSFGAQLLALGVIQWLTKDLTGASVRPIIIGGLIANGIGTIVALMGTLGGVMNALGWSAVVIYLLLGLGFAYFQFMAPSK